MQHCHQLSQNLFFREIALNEHGTLDWLDVQQIKANHEPFGSALVYRNLRPATGRSTQIYNNSPWTKETEFFIDLKQLVARPGSITFPPGAKYVFILFVII